MSRRELTLRDLVLREYLRVSKDSSGRSRSPDQQHSENLAVAERNGWSLHPEPYKDHNRSASLYAKRERENFTKLLADLEEGSFDADALALWESSRGSRQVSEWVYLIDLCAEKGVGIWVTTHNRLYDPVNARDRRSLLEDAVDAEYESAKSSERLQRNMRENAERGRPHGANIYGYKRIYNPENGELEKVIRHPGQAVAVEEAARRVLAGESLHAVAKDFNARGIAPRGKALRKHNEAYHAWTGSSVKQMLSTPAYAKKRLYQGEILDEVEPIWPALIDPARWEELQGRLFPEDQKLTNTWSTKHLLSGLAYCECGSPMKYSQQYQGRLRHDENGKALPRPKRHAYACRAKFHTTMTAEHLDAMVTEVVLARLERPDFLESIGRADDKHAEERQALREEIAENVQWLEDVQVRAEQERNLDLLFRQEALVRPKIEAAQKRLEQLAAMDPAVIDLSRSGAVRQTWEELDLQQKRRVIKALVAPRVKKAKPGQKGVNWDRVEFVWKYAQ